MLAKASMCLTHSCHEICLAWLQKRLPARHVPHTCSTGKGRSGKPPREQIPGS